MARPRLWKGDSIDGFVVGDLVHTGGMALLYEATRPDRPGEPMLMKVPRLFEGEDPAAIVSFEMEQMILPRLSGPHVPACHATGDFARQAYVVMETIAGQTLYSRLGALPLSYEEARDRGDHRRLACGKRLLGHPLGDERRRHDGVLRLCELRGDGRANHRRHGCGNL